MDPKEFKRLLKEFAPEQQITEADIQPTGPDGEKNYRPSYYQKFKSGY